MVQRIVTDNTAFRIDVVNGRNAVLCVAGDVDLATVDQFAEAIDLALDDRPDVLRLDLSGVTFLDSSGVKSLITVSMRARATGTELVAVGIPAQTKRLLEMTGLNDLFDRQEPGVTP